MKALYGKGTWKARPSRRAKTHFVSSPLVPKLKPESGPFVVQGQRASDLEYRTYKALKRLGWDDGQIDFQYPLDGGRQPGGQIIDFLLQAYGRTVAIAVDGDYWHNRTVQQIQDDKLKQAALVEAFGTRPVTFIKLNSGDLLDDEMAYRRLLREAGRG